MNNRPWVMISSPLILTTQMKKIDTANTITTCGHILRCKTEDHINLRLKTTKFYTFIIA